MTRHLIFCAVLFAACSTAHAEERLVPAPKGAPMLLEALADGVQI